jgi:CRP-like cAMP-binding protein
LHRITSTEIVVPKELGPERKSALSAALYDVHCQIFDGVDKGSFVKYVIDSTAERTWVLLHKGEEGQIVGYLAIHVFERQLRGKLAAVFRAEAGTLRAYRGRNSSVNFFLRKLIEHLVQHPGRPVYYLGSLVHPSSYSLFTKYAEEVWPNATTPVPADIGQFMSQLADDFGIPVVDPKHPLVRQVGWITRETDVERRYWRHCDRPAARFFISENPGYVDGHGLVTVVPIRLAPLLRVAGRIAVSKGEIWLDSAKIAAQRLPIGSQLLRPVEVGKLLRSVKLFADLDQKSLDTLIASAEIVGVGPGTFVIRKDEPGQDMYLLARGAVYVLAGPPGDEVVIDEMDKGSVFGEIAMLSGSTRTASIRTATACTLVRIQRKALFPLMKHEPALRDAIWRAFAARVFDDFIRASGRHEDLDREARAAWIARGQARDMEAGQTETFQGSAFVFALSGTVELEQNGTWTVSQAPLMVDGAGPLKLRARTDSRVVTVPPLRG